MSTKNPLTPAGIEPTTFRFVAQHLNHCATAVPTSTSSWFNNLYMKDMLLEELKVLTMVLMRILVLCGMMLCDWVK